MALLAPPPGALTMNYSSTAIGGSAHSVPYNFGQQPLGTRGIAAASAAKLQLVQSPTFRSSPLREGVYGTPTRFSPLGASLPGKKCGASKRLTRSAGSLEVEEVRALASDTPVKEGTEHLKGPHDALMQRLKSRTAKQEAEVNRVFLATYQAESVSSAASEAKLDALLKGTAQRAEKTRQSSEDLALEVADAERKLEKVNVVTCNRASEQELQALNPFERSQRKIQEDKTEEDLQKQRDEVQINHAKLARRLQNELIELRDFKVLLREFKHIKLEKLQETLRGVQDGRRLRACVREMIRHGAQRILQKLEATDLPLEPWMHEVLVNSCHVEIRIEEAEEKLLHIRREALKPVKDGVQPLLSQTKQERFDNLCARTWEGRFGAAARKQGGGGGGEEQFGMSTSFQGTRELRLASDPGAAGELGSTLGATRRRAPDTVYAEMRAAENNIASLRRLLNDMRHNAAAVICNKIRQVEKGACREESREAMEWGSEMLSMLVSEDFAKTTMKELQKSAPHAKLTQ